MQSADAPYVEYLQESLLPRTEYATAEKDMLAGKSHVLIPITYISPNYISLRTLAIAAGLTRLGNRVSIMLNDSHISTHVHVLQSSGVIMHMASGSYVQQIVDQMTRIIEAFGGQLGKLRVVKASDMWASITGNYDRFIDFYRLLGSLKVYGKDLEGGDFEEAYHILEKPFSVFVFSNFKGIAKSDFGEADYLLLSNKDPEPYKKASALLVKESGTGNYEKRILTMRLAPQLQHDDMYPCCYMKPRDIRRIVDASAKGSDVENIYKLFIRPTCQLLSGTGKANLADVRKPRDNHELCQAMYRVFESIVKIVDSSPGSRNSDLKVASPLQASNLRRLLASRKITSMLKYCNGENTIAEIAKSANLHISNASVYISRLREAGIVSTDKRPRLLVSNITIPIKTLTA